jgi:hypothetical protein
MIGKIERVPLRDLWKHETYDFTTWLQDNIDILNLLYSTSSLYNYVSFNKVTTYDMLLYDDGHDK